MGAVEFKGQSYFAKDIKEKNTLYMMDELDCVGNESALIDCNFAGWGVHNCRDMEVGSQNPFSMFTGMITTNSPFINLSHSRSK